MIAFNSKKNRINFLDGNSTKEKKSTKKCCLKTINKEEAEEKEKKKKVREGRDKVWLCLRSSFFF